MPIRWTQSQRDRLEWAARHAQPPYVRVKALAVANVAGGEAIVPVARTFRVSRQALGEWCQRFVREGLEGLRVYPGRGRKPRVNSQELERYVRQSPRQFGISQTRWTLAILAQTVPSLKGFSPPGVRKALHRMGFRYKRGQPRLHSPDPEYEPKKGRWWKPSGRHRSDRNR